jgi:uncharacterized membrane protein
MISTRYRLLSGLLLVVFHFDGLICSLLIGIQLRLQRFESGTEQHTLSIQHSLQAERESFEQARTEWEATQQVPFITLSHVFTLKSVC